jgi:DNA-binding CsgD family transcriptional regulator
VVQLDSHGNLLIAGPGSTTRICPSLHPAHKRVITICHRDHPRRTGSGWACRYAFDLVADSAQGVGYLLKEKVGDLRTFTDAVRRVAEGGSALDPDVVERLIGRRRRREGPLDRLTAREREVLALIAQGRSIAGVAEDLVITVAAVEPHVTSIFDKLGLHQSPEQHRRVLAVLTYLEA